MVDSDADWGLNVDESGQCEVFVANGLDFPDGLSASGYGFPVLLTEADAIPAETLAELNRLAGPTDPFCGSGDLTINVVGGTTAVSSPVFEQLATFTSSDGSIQRLGGANRYGTALEVADYWGAGDTVVIATGLNFPDALAAGPLAAIAGPILLNDGPTIRPDVGAFLKAEEIVNVYIVGGTAVVPQSVEDELTFEYGITVTRLAGDNRAETAVEVAEELIGIQGSGDYSLGVILVNGNTFADALSAGPLGYFWSFPILLVNADSIPAATAAHHVKYSVDIADVIAVGGTSVISKTVLDGAVAAAKPSAAKISSATLATSNVKQGVFVLGVDGAAPPVPTLTVTAKADTAADGPGVNDWSISTVQTGVLGADTVKVLTKASDCTPDCTGFFPRFEISVASIVGLRYDSFVALWNGSPAGTLTTAATTTPAVTLAGAVIEAGPSTRGRQDATVVVTFDQKISLGDSNFADVNSGVYTSSNVAADQLLLADDSTNTLDAAQTKLTMKWINIEDSDEVAVVGNDEVRFETNTIETMTGVRNTTAAIVLRLTAA
jgi:hypothetical protein